MSSRSSNSDSRRLLPVGRVAGHRGRDGEFTVKVWAGDAALWESVGRVWLVSENRDDGSFHRVRSSRSYRDRWVLAIEGVLDSDGAAALRGKRVEVAQEDAPDLPEGRYYRAELIGYEVLDATGTSLGRVKDIVNSGGADLLSVSVGDDGDESIEREVEEVLIPMARELIIEVDRNAGRIQVRVPDGLLDLNRR